MLVSRFFQLSLKVFNVFRVTGRSFNEASIGGCKLFVGDTKSLSTVSDDIANSYLEGKGLTLSSSWLASAPLDALESSSACPSPAFLRSSICFSSAWRSSSASIYLK